MIKHMSDIQQSTPVSHATQEESILDLRGLLHLLQANKWFILCVVAIFLFIGGIYAWTRIPQYQSQALIEVEGSSTNASNLLAMLGVGGDADMGAISKSASPAEVETALLQSQYILGDVIETLRLNIIAEPHYFPIVGKWVAQSAKPGDKPGWLSRLLPYYAWGKERLTFATLDVPNYLRDQPFELVVGSNHSYCLYSKQGEKILSGMVGQLVDSQNKAYPIRVQVESLVAPAGMRFTVEKRAIKSVLNGVIANLSIMEKGLNTGILQLAYQSPTPAFSQRFLNALLATTVEKNVQAKSVEAAKTLSFLKKQLPAVASDLDQAEKKLNDYRTKTGTVNTQAETTLLLQEVSSLENEIQELKLKRLELEQDFTNYHPYIVALEKKQREVSKKLASVQAKLRKLPQAEQQAVNIKRDISVQGNIYSGVIQNMQQMEMLKASTVSTVRVLTQASFPVNPVPAKTSLIMVLSALLGFMFSIIFLLLRQSLNRSVDDPSKVEHVLGVQTLALIPFSANQMRLVKKAKAEQVKQSHLLVNESPRDVAVEALRALRTALKLSCLDDDQRLISISGCSPGVGKSFVSANLTALFADLGGKVLLIDADMRRGHANVFFNAHRMPGLAEYLQTNTPSSEVIQSSVGNVDIITAGHYPAKPAELLMRDKLTELMQYARNHYDIVIVDTPPILAVTDAVLIAKHCDVNMLVVGLGKDQLKEVQHAKSTMEKANIELDGFVYNNLTHSTHKYGYGGYYNYHYNYDGESN